MDAGLSSFPMGHERSGVTSHLKSSFSGLSIITISRPANPVTSDPIISRPECHCLSTIHVEENREERKREYKKEQRKNERRETDRRETTEYGKAGM